MPRGDGTGPWGTGPTGSNGCLGFGRGFGAGGRRWFRCATNSAVDPKVLDEQANLLEKRAANLRSLANQNRKAE